MVSKSNKKISAQLRKREIAKILADAQAVSIPELAEKFNVSEMTIRRDLDSLESTGRVKRTHGGAMASQRMVFEFNFASRREANYAAKVAIVKEAIKLIKPGMRIIIDTGTTTLELAHLLRKKFKDQLTVITPSLAVASELQFCENIQTILLGGLIRKGSPDLTGMIAETVLDMFAADIAFQGADAIGLDGALYNSDMRISKVDKKIRSRSAKTYVLAASSKLGKTELTRQGFLKDVEALITDNQADKAILNKLKKVGATIKIVAIDE